MGSKLLLGAVHLSLPERLKVKNKKKGKKKSKSFHITRSPMAGWLGGDIVRRLGEGGRMYIIMRFNMDKVCAHTQSLPSATFISIVAKLLLPFRREPDEPKTIFEKKHNTN